MLTKSGVWGILAISCNIFRHDPAWGTLILTLGTVTMVLGAVLATFSIDLKRTLACSSMSQIGFVLVGVGMMGILGEENALAARGALLQTGNDAAGQQIARGLAGHHADPHVHGRMMPRDATSRKSSSVCRCSATSGSACWRARSSARAVSSGKPRR